MSQQYINFLHLCDAATIDGSGKLNIIGIFNKIYLKEIPSKILKFAAVIAIGFEKITRPKNILEIKIIDSKKEELNIQPPIKINLDIPQFNVNKKSELNLILDIGNLEFKNFGKHFFNVYFNEDNIGVKEFNVEMKGDK